MKRVAVDELPDAWQKQITAVVSPPNGRFVAAGERVRSSGQAAGRLEQMFFPGHRNRPADFLDLATAADGTFTAKAWRNGQVIAELSRPGRVDPRTGWLQIDRIPGNDGNKFGATVSTFSAQAGVGSDGALYVKQSVNSAGVVLFLPAVGTASSWGRWLPAALMDIP